MRPAELEDPETRFRLELSHHFARLGNRDILGRIGSEALERREVGREIGSGRQAAPDQIAKGGRIGQGWIGRDVVDPPPRLALSRGILTVTPRHQHVDRGSILIPRTVTGQMAHDARRAPLPRNQPRPCLSCVWILDVADLLNGRGIETTNGMGPGLQAEPDQTTAEADAPTQPQPASQSVQTNHNGIFYREEMRSQYTNDQP